VNRRALGRQVAQVREERYRLLGTEAIEADLERLDEHRLARRRLASEQRRYDRLSRLLARASETEQQP